MKYLKLYEELTSTQRIERYGANTRSTILPDGFDEHTDVYSKGTKARKLIEEYAPWYDTSNGCIQHMDDESNERSEWYNGI